MLRVQGLEVGTVKVTGLALIESFHVSQLSVTPSRSPGCSVALTRQWMGRRLASTQLTTLTLPVIRLTSRSFSAASGHLGKSPDLTFELQAALREAW